MATYIKVDGAWQATTRPYLKQNGLQVPVKEVYVKAANVWQSSYQYDTTPPPVPELGLQIVDNRYIRVSTRVPVTTTQLKRIRILMSETAYPTGPLGSGYISTNANQWPNEDWSDWYYNGASATSDHGPTTEYDFKDYPPRAVDSTNLAGGKYYYFSAWSQDFEDNWSVGITNKIYMPKEGVKADKILLKEAYFQPTSSGSLNTVGTVYTQGDVVANANSHGVWFYSNQMDNSMGVYGPATVRGAQILVQRSGSDPGLPIAQVNLYRHDETGFSAPLAFGSMVNLGTISRGESKWFALPDSWLPLLRNTTNGFGLKGSAEASSVITALSHTDSVKCGQLDVIWEEAL